MQSEPMTAPATKPDAVDKRPESGAARVRRVLIAGLADAGVVRGKGVTVDAHAALCDKLCDRLAYLEEPLLIVLREAALRLAEGVLHNQWPGFATVWNMAVRLQAPPDVDLPIMTTWLTSIEGPRALAGGYIVELRSWLRQHGVPPGSYDLVQIKGRAADNQRRVERLRAMAVVGRCGGDDLDWLTRYDRAHAYCRALVAEGDAKRAAAAVVVRA